MTPTNQKYRDALREIECVAAAALANQPHGDAECEKHLVDALKKITYQCYVIMNGPITDQITCLYFKREAIRAVAAIAKGKIAKTPPGEESDRLRKIADKMKESADETADIMVDACGGLV